MDYQSATLNLALAQSAYSALVPVKDKADALVSELAHMQVIAAQALTKAQADLGSTSAPTVGLKSSVTTRAEAERAAGQGAAIDFIKANPACDQVAALTAWETGAGATIPAGKTRLLHDPAGVLEEYMVNAFAAGAITAQSWAAFSAFVVATDKPTLMGM